jgi:DNA-directed RNA polymerase subunit RPC12/RpoP
MGIAVVTLIILAVVLALMNKVTSGLVCPYCEGGPLRRAYEKTECTQCGRLFFLWQAKRK